MNKLLAVLQKIHLMCQGRRPLKVVLDGKWYTVEAAQECEDNVVLTIKAD